MTGGIRVESLAKEFNGVRVFDDVEFAILPGKHQAIVGPSGCGKSTLLRLIAGLDTPSIGCVSIDGMTVSEGGRILVPPHKRGVGMVFQDLALWPNLNALENVSLGLSAYRGTGKERTVLAREMLHICRVEELASRRPHALSVGQQQRVALARTLAIRPKWILLDEPFTGLDLVLKERLFEDLIKLVDEVSATMVLVTHDPREATALCKNLLVMENGGIIERGFLKDILEKPLSATMKAFRSTVSP